MIDYNFIGLARLVGCLLLAASPLAVRADLTYENINGASLIYDSVDHTTWTQNADITYPTTYNFLAANAWAAALIVPGVDADWVLPNATELRNLFLQMYGTGNVLGGGDEYGTQVSFGSGPNDYASNVQTTYWTSDSEIDFNFFYGYGGSFPNSDLYAAWAIEAAPEPSAGLMGLLTFGVLGGGLYLRRRAVRA